MIAENLILQGQLKALTNKAQDSSSNILQEPVDGTKMDEYGPNKIQGGGGQASDSKGSAGIRGGSNQSLGSKCLDDPPPWSHGAVPTGQVLSVQDLLPYQGRLVTAQEGSKEAQGPSRHQESYVDNTGVSPIQGGRGQGFEFLDASGVTQWLRDDWDWSRGCAPKWGRGEGSVTVQGTIWGQRSTYITQLPPTTQG
jgi:hypothetical protein